jgi:Family of unknown function (DUF6088)
MSFAENIRQQIDKFDESLPFRYDDLDISSGNFLSAAKALERMQKKGLIKKISKGQFYKPKQTVFGELGPDYNLVTKANLFKNKKRIAYVTGAGLYNSLQLNTQQSFTTTIATNEPRKKIKVGYAQIKTVKAYVPISEKNYKYLGVLDAIKDINRIADTSNNTACKRLMRQLKTYDEGEIKILVKCCISYPPRTRALLGAMLTKIGYAENDLLVLKRSLNAATKFKVSINIIDGKILKNWNIK